MAVVYTQAKAILVTQANALATEATSAGLTTLASSLTSLSSEITTNISSGTDSEWAGTTGTLGLFQIYTQELQSAAQIVRSKIANTTAGYTNTIQTKLTSIDTNIASQSTAITALNTNLSTMATNSTTMKTLAQGTGIHMVGPWEWIGIASLVKVFQQTNQDLVALKNYVENSVPRTF